MRMWNVDVRKMCRKHLLGEHVEIHMFVGCLNKKKNVEGYLYRGLLEIHNLKRRHKKIAEEMERRGMKHKSELLEFKIIKRGKIDVSKNIEELNKRCDKCFKDE